MKWLNKLERKLGRYAIPNLMYYIIGVTMAVYMVQYILNISLFYYLAFIPSFIMQGQIWRIITFIFIPPASSIITIAFVMYFYYMMGTTLEQEWGTFKFNIYYLFGMIGTIIAAFLTGAGTSVYLNLSLFLAFAYLFPDIEILLFFILPIKVKYLAYLDWAYFIFSLLLGTMSTRVAAIASLINFFIFFGGDFIKYIKYQRKYGATRRNFKREMKKYKR
ncbi:membrane associated rhomboid family serine protease [Sedimentibacter acidaminivorans]|jgi:membrane associated rhomboid family serine protease|uniref:Membrane associated rhomboid family serine protease n=1 Tax=Sedimentibacter acidaminivorans TaxID=913099 RepID=A0ABS4GA52_9FIRM|nr:rhomboid family intramembrane serine protease [Sedimentibacter acidaminivorans]MBP1924549.1 membrane associated rhomboid family serine protease [Sedimentibacter acidaminivorans]